MACSTPYKANTSHKIMPYRHPNPPRSVEEMARGMCEAHFQVKMYKTPHVRATFGSCDVAKVYAVVVRSTFPSQHVQNTTCSRHFLEVRMLKKCKSLWREAHFEAKMYKTPHVRATFGGLMSLRFKTLHYRTFNTLHSSTLHYTPVHSTTLNYTTPHYITLNDTATQIDR